MSSETTPETGVVTLPVLAGDPVPASELRADGVPALVVEPEAQVREVLVSLLRAHGYIVRESAGPRAARASAPERAAPCDVVLAGPGLDVAALHVVVDEATRDHDRIGPATSSVARSAGSATEGNGGAAIVALGWFEPVPEGAPPLPAVDDRLPVPVNPRRLLETIDIARRRRRLPSAPRVAAPPERRIPAAAVAHATHLRTALVLVLGYAVIGSVDLLLRLEQGALTSETETASASTPPRRERLPPELTADEEHVLWASLTRTVTTSEVDVTVTALTAELVAARAYRTARAAGAIGAPPKDEVRAAIADLDLETRATIELHVVAKGEQQLDVKALVASLRLDPEAGSGSGPGSGPPVPPIAVTDPETTSERPGDGGPLVVRAVRFSASFPRLVAERTEVHEMRLDAASTTVLVPVTFPDPGASAR